MPLRRLLCLIVIGLLPASLWAQVEAYEVRQHDADGDVVSVCRYAVDDSALLSSAAYVYRRGGTLAAIVTYHYADSGTVESRLTAFYNAKGQITARLLYLPDETVQMEEHYRYDRHGRLAQRKQTVYDDDGPTKVIERRHYHKESTTVKVSINGNPTCEYKR